MKALFVPLLTSGLLWVATATAQDIWATPDADKSAPAQPAAAQPAPATATTPPANGQPAQRFETVALEAQTYEARVLLGLRQIVLRDFDGAVATFRRAAQLEPNSPAAFCHLGDVQLERNYLPEAKAAFESCQRFAGVAADERYVTLALVGLARTFERTKGEQKELRDAWARARDGTEDELAKRMASDRVEKYDAAIAREAAHVAVRRRIVERDVIRESQSDAASDPERGL
jgi:tetratricopeptide (TPR) repeat protein